MRPYTSNVPAALAALVEIVTAAAQGSPAVVKDGPWTSEETSDVIAIGWEGFLPGYEYPARTFAEDTGSAAVTVQTSQRGLQPTLIEVITINCGAIAQVGSGKIPQARERAFGYQSLVASVATVPPYLNGTVAKLTFNASGATRQMANRRGAVVAVSFSLECEAWAQ